MVVIGITGTLGAGKGTVAEYLVKKGFLHLQVRDFLVEIIRTEGHEVNRDAMFEMGNRLRAENGPAYITDQLYEKAVKSGQNCVIESLRNPAEVEGLKRHTNFLLFAVDADQKTRYERIVSRAGEKDKVSFEKFAEQEAKEMTSTDKFAQNLSACIQMADYKFMNNGTREELEKQVDKIILNIPSQ